MHYTLHTFLHVWANGELSSNMQDTPLVSDHALRQSCPHLSHSACASFPALPLSSYHNIHPSFFHHREEYEQPNDHHLAETQTLHHVPDEASPETTHLSSSLA